MDNTADWVVIGRFGRPQGLKGLIRIISFTEPRENILTYLPWFCEINQQWHPVRLVRTESNHHHILVEIDGSPGRDEVAHLTNCNIAMKREALPDLAPGEYYWHELNGMTVITKEGLELGVVSDVFATGSNDVLVVLGEKRHLIPYLPGEYVIDINNDLRQITVDWDADF